MAMIHNRSRHRLTAYSLILPFVAIFALVFGYPVIEVIRMSFTDAPLIGEGDWVGWDNYARLFSDRLFYTSVVNNGYFVLLTVVPTTVIALVISLAVNRLSGRMQALALVFFSPRLLRPLSCWSTHQVPVSGHSL